MVHAGRTPGQGGWPLWEVAGWRWAAQRWALTDCTFSESEWCAPPTASASGSASPCTPLPPCTCACPGPCGQARPCAPSSSLCPPAALQQQWGGTCLHRHCPCRRPCTAGHSAGSTGTSVRLLSIGSCAGVLLALRVGPQTQRGGERIGGWIRHREQTKGQSDHAQHVKQRTRSPLGVSIIAHRDCHQGEVDMTTTTTYTEPHSPPLRLFSPKVMGRPKHAHACRCRATDHVVHRFSVIQALPDPRRRSQLWVPGRNSQRRVCQTQSLVEYRPHGPGDYGPGIANWTEGNGDRYRLYHSQMASPKPAILVGTNPVPWLL
jgi:hypothetical protein